MLARWRRCLHKLWCGDERISDLRCPISERGVNSLSLSLSGSEEVLRPPAQRRMAQGLFLTAYTFGKSFTSSDHNHTTTPCLSLSFLNIIHSFPLSFLLDHPPLARKNHHHGRHQYFLPTLCSHRTTLLLDSSTQHARIRCFPFALSLVCIRLCPVLSHLEEDETLFHVLWWTCTMSSSSLSRFCHRQKGLASPHFFPFTCLHRWFDI